VCRAIHEDSGEEAGGDEDAGEGADGRPERAVKKRTMSGKTRSLKAQKNRSRLVRGP